MQAMKYKAEVGADGEVIVPVRKSEAEDQEGVRRLSAKTMDYWDNPIDDKVWSNA